MKSAGKMNVNEGLCYYRRQFLQLLAGIGFGGFLVEKAEGTEINRVEFKPLDKDDKIDIGNSGEEILQKAYELGYKYEKEHKGCARCTVAALQDSIGFIPEDNELFRTASCLDGGATPIQKASCGAFTGAGMIIGWTCGTRRFGDNAFPRELIHKVYDRFAEEYGSVICEIVRKKSEKNCPEVVGKAARWTAEILLKQFTNY